MFEHGHIGDVVENLLVLEEIDLLGQKLVLSGIVELGLKFQFSLRSQGLFGSDDQSFVELS